MASVHSEEDKRPEQPGYGCSTSTGFLWVCIIPWPENAVG